MSIMPQPLPSRCAAMPRMAPTVTTPVPPTPSMIAGPALAPERETAGSGTPSSGSALPAMPSAFRILAPCTVTKDGQKPLTQEKSLLQLDWSMRALAAEFGLDRLDRDAVRLHAAIAAAFADQFVDEDALVGIGKGAALAAAALFGGAGLVVEQHRHALDVAQLALHEVEVVAVMDGGAGREIRRVPAYLSGSSVTTAMRSTPSARTCLAIMSTVRPPSCGWPPVMATASL